METKYTLISVLFDLVKMACGAWLILNLSGCATTPVYAWKVQPDQTTQFETDKSKCSGVALLNPHRQNDLYISCLLQKGYKLEAVTM